MSNCRILFERIQLAYRFCDFPARSGIQLYPKIFVASLLGYRWDTMADRKNIKVSPDTHERLVNSKPDNSTWDGYLNHILDAYHDPRPRIPRWGKTLEEVAMSREDREELAEQARELQSQVNFKELLQEKDDASEASAVLIAELTADRVVEKLETKTNV